MQLVLIVKKLIRILHKIWTNISKVNISNYRLDEWYGWNIWVVFEGTSSKWLLEHSLKLIWFSFKRIFYKFPSKLIWPLNCIQFEAIVKWDLRNSSIIWF